MPRASALRAIVEKHVVARWAGGSEGLWWLTWTIGPVDVVQTWTCLYVARGEESAPVVRLAQRVEETSRHVVERWWRGAA
jgi:hypothetical protein